MPFDEGVAVRVRAVLASRSDVDERKMFGGIAFMIRGHMACGVLDKRLIVRVGPEQYEASLDLPHAAEMDFTGRPMRGFVTVQPDGFASRESLEAWVGRGIDFVCSLPPKQTRARS